VFDPSLVGLPAVEQLIKNCCVILQSNEVMAIGIPKSTSNSFFLYSSLLIFEIKKTVMILGAYIK